MFINFLRSNKIISSILTVLRVYLGYTWFTAGFGKITGGFDASGFIQGAIANASGENPTVEAWWAGFLKVVALPNIELFNVMVSWGELLVGTALILGLFTSFAALMALFLNFSFLLSGTVSTNAQMVILTAIILVAGYNAGRIGLDRWALPFLKTYAKESKAKKHVVSA